LSISVYIST